MRWFIAVFVQTREINEQLNMISNIETHGIMFFVLFFSFILIHISATPSGGGETTEVKISDGSDAYCNGQPTKDPMCLTQKQFKRAEIADAVLGTEPPENTAGIKALIPKTTSSTPCEKEVDEKDEVMEEREEVDMVVNQEVAMTEEVDTKQEHPTKGEEQNSTDTAKAYKVNCDKRSISGLETFTVHVLNASQDLMDFLNSNSSECSLVLFYTSWCQFSAQLAPHFNALPRVFPIMHFLALDASQHSSLSTRFGTVAVPNILLFQGAKPMARFNHTERTLEILTAFITNQTGFDAVVGQMVMDEDHVGPLLGAPVKSIDWLFVFSVLFLSVFSLYAILRTDSIRLLIPGHEHDHQD